MSGSSKWKILAAVAIVVVAAVAFYLLRGGLGPQQEATGGKIIWKYSIWGPPRAVTSGIEKMKEMWEKAGKGRFEMQIGYGGSFAPAKEHLDSIKSGVIDAATVCIGYGPAKTPLAQVVELPFLLTESTEVNARVIDAVMRNPLIEEELRTRWNAKYLAPTVLTPYEFMGNRRIAHISDMKGVRMRISGASATVLEKFGAVATMVTAPETYTALERGTIDMVGFPWSDSFGAFRLHEVSKYATLGLAMGGFGCYTAASIDSWNKLPDDLKAMLPDVREQVMQTYFKVYKEADQKWLPIFKKTLEIVPFPAAERAKMVEASKPLWKQWAQEQDKAGRKGSEILRFTQEQVAKFSAQH